MNGPDGLEQRTADAEERAWFEDDQLTLDEQLADEFNDVIREISGWQL